MTNSFDRAYELILDELQTSLQDIRQREVDRLLDTIPKVENIFLLGAGRMGIVLSSFAMRLNHLGFCTYIVGSVNCPPITCDDLLLVASSSGETSTVREIVRKAHEVNAEIIAITAIPDSTVGKLSSAIIRFKAPSSLESAEDDQVISKQPMKTLFEQALFIFLESLVLLLMDRTKQTASDMAKRHANLE